MRTLTALSLSALVSGSAFAQLTGPSTASSPYIRPVLPGYETISVLTVDNTGATPDDVVPKVGGGTYSLNGIPDGMGAFDNNNGTFTVLLNHELGNGSGAVRDHGSAGAYVSRFVIDKNTLAVLSGEDLTKQIFRWNTSTQSSEATALTYAFNRFCSGDLPAVSAYYNAASGLGTQARIYMNGEEGGSTGYVLASVATGPDAGKGYILGKFNLSTNGSGLTAVGAWENVVACPYAQDKTVVVGLNDGGTGIMSNSVAVYVGTKQAFGTEVEKAGLTNGILKFINVAGSTAEIVNSTTRATNITNGTRFSLSGTSATVFSRPEDGAWNPLNPRQFYFVTTDRLDQVSDGLGTQVGSTRLWRLTFDDLSNPDLGGVIDLLIDGRTVGTEKVNMFDNMTVNESNGHVLLQEDVGGAAHNGKLWDYDPVTNALVKIARHDTARFGDVGVAATAPFTNDEEGSGIIDISAIMKTSAMNKGNPREAWYLTSDQAHYTTGITAAQVEGGQLLTIHDLAPVNNVTVIRGAFTRDRRSGAWVQQVTLKNDTASALVGPFFLVIDSLSANATVVSPLGTTSAFAPASPYVLVSNGSLAAGATVTVSVQFNNPTNATITYSPRVINSVAAP